MDLGEFVLIFVFIVASFCIGLGVSPKNNDAEIILQCKQYGVAVIDDNFVQCQVVPPQPVQGV